MANNGERKIKIFILKPSYFIMKGSRMWPEDAKWKNIYIFNQNWIVKNSRKTAIFLKIVMLCK